MRTSFKNYSHFYKKFWKLFVYMALLFLHKSYELLAYSHLMELPLSFDCLIYLFLSLNICFLFLMTFGFFFHFIFICDANLACLRLPKVKILTIHLSHLPAYIEANISDITKVERWVKSWLLKFRPRSYSTIELLNNLSHIES